MGTPGARRYDSQIPNCRSCHSRNVVPIGPVKVVRWIDRVEARCGDCGKEWSSENQQLVRLARDLMKAKR